MRFPHAHHDHFFFVINIRTHLHQEDHIRPLKYEMVRISDLLSSVRYINRGEWQNSGCVAGAFLLFFVYMSLALAYILMT